MEPKCSGKATKNSTSEKYFDITHDSDEEDSYDYATNEKEEALALEEEETCDNPIYLVDQDLNPSEDPPTYEKLAGRSKSASDTLCRRKKAQLPFSLTCLRNLCLCH
ncbi:unnamed protein product [Protopolystoma xenopodis]|uniref:Uncharacterized protein n=1 Tax=Protopolystoma xenopodis TaxID=117903 RepID=A0A448X8D7_9PLAT|nr:unnamed protein product [Protopolystoma xenopodis]